MTLTIVKDRPLSPAEITKKEDLLDPKQFKAKCPKCGAVTRSDKEITDDDLCICERVPEDKKLIVCNAAHPELLSRGQLIMSWSCKKCEEIKRQQTPEQIERSQEFRRKQQEDSKAGAELLKRMEDAKAKDKANEKKAEAELFAAVLTKQLMPLFEGLKQEIRNDRNKTES